MHSIKKDIENSFYKDCASLDIIDLYRHMSDSLYTFINCMNILLDSRLDNQLSTGMFCLVVYLQMF